MSVLNLQVGAAGDDGTDLSPFFLSDAGPMNIGDGGSFVWSGWARFTGVSGLDGATLNSVTYSTWGNAGGSGSPLTTVAFENATAPAVPSSTADFASKTRTTKINWDGAQATGQFNASPELKTSLDDIAGSISVIQVLHDDRSSSSAYLAIDEYDQDTSHAPKLDIDYTTPDPGDLNVLDGVTSIADGQATPVDFGSVEVDGTPPQKTFTIENLGDLTISITTITVPTGYEIDAGSELDGGADTIAGGTSKDLVVNLLTASVGTKTGDITINSDDGDEGAYNFAVTGTVLNLNADTDSDRNNQQFMCNR